MRILLWHVHGSWATAFLSGRHEYVLPVLPDRGPDGLGRARTWDWPASVTEVPPDRLRDTRPDAVLLQRPHEAELLRAWTGLRAGHDLPAFYVEHNTPRGDVETWRHPLAGQDRIPVVHVTDYNRMLWDSGRAPVHVVEHGVPDPGPLWTGELPRLAMSVNDPIDRWLVAGMDVAAGIAREVPVDVYGMRTESLAGKEPAFADGRHDDLVQRDLHAAFGRHRAYLHTYRWTSLGLSLLEAMAVGSPVLAFAATAAPRAVPPEAGTVAHDGQTLLRAARALIADPDLAAEQGRAARRHVLEHHGLPRFLDAWDALLERRT